jgi:hypothetical protein
MNPADSVNPYTTVVADTGRLEAVPERKPRAAMMPRCSRRVKDAIGRRGAARRLNRKRAMSRGALRQGVVGVVEDAFNKRR